MPTPVTFTEVLPQHAHPKRPAMEWTPVNEPSGPHVGYLSLHTARETTEYRVETFPADVGYGVCLMKLAPGSGSDKTESHYCLSVTRAGVVECECRGFIRHGHCKHADAVKACLENRWL